MLWEVSVAGDSSGELSSSVTVEATSWFTALRNALSRIGMDGHAVSNISCEKQDNGWVRITDYVSGRKYLLRQVDSPESVRGSDLIEFLVDGLGQKKDLKDRVPHSVFSQRDVPPDDERGLLLKEKVVSVAVGTGWKEATELAQEICEELRLANGDQGTRLMISVRVIEETADNSSEGTAIVVLTWKDWNPHNFDFQYPLAGDEMPVRKIFPIYVGDGNQMEPDAENRSPLHRQQDNRGPQFAQRESGEIDGSVMRAFERLQTMYGMKGYNQVAKFALDVCMELIPCEAGNGMLLTPGKNQLYVAAAMGDVVSSVEGRRLSLSQGILGFAIRSGTVVNVSDPSDDDRFEAEFDFREGFDTRSILCVPLQHEGKIVGAIELLNSSRVEGFSQVEANVLSYVAGAVGEYIELSLPSRESEFLSSEFAEFVPPPPAPVSPLKAITMIQQRISQIPHLIKKK